MNKKIKMKIIKELIPKRPSSLFNRIPINCRTSEYIYKILNENNNSYSNLTNTRYETNKKGKRF